METCPTTVKKVEISRQSVLYFTELLSNITTCTTSGAPILSNLDMAVEDITVITVMVIKCARLS